MDGREKARNQWPNLKKEWANRIGDYIDAELRAQEEALASKYEPQVEALRTELAQAQAAHKYEATQRDDYATRNAALQQALDDLSTKVTALDKVVGEMPFGDIDIVLTPGKITDRAQYIRALANVSNWMDLLNFKGDTMVQDEQGESVPQPEGDGATVLTDTALPDSVVTPDVPPVAEPTSEGEVVSDQP